MERRKEGGGSPGSDSFDIHFQVACSGGQVAFISSGVALLPLLVKVTTNSLDLIRYLFIIVTVPLKLQVTGILNVTKLLLFNTKSNELRSRAVTTLFEYQEE
jgi:hypothetical protein